MTVPSRHEIRLGWRFVAACFAVFVSQSAGCVSAETGRALDRTHQAAEARASRLEHRSIEPEVDLSSPIDRDTIVRAAITRSPALKVMAHRARALIHAGRAEGSLPAAELGFEAWNLALERPYALGEADMYMLELRQRFPAAGSLDARARALAEEAQAVLAEVATEERVVAQRAGEAFARYARASAARSLQQQQLALLERMGQAIGARYSTGGASLADAARVELEVAKAQRSIAGIAGDIAQARAELNALLRRPITAPLGEPREGPALTVRIPVDELLSRATKSRGSTVAAEARYRAAQARHDAAEAEASAPEIMVGLGYWQDPSMRPGFGVTASMSLPWLWGPQRHRVTQAEEESAAEHSATEASDAQAQAEITGAQAQLAAIEAQLVVLHRQALPAARRSIDALTAAYATGNTSLLEWVDAARSVLDLEIEAVDLRGQLAISIEALESAVGAPLPRVALAPEESL